MIVTNNNEQSFFPIFSSALLCLSLSFPAVYLFSISPCFFPFQFLAMSLPLMLFFRFFLHFKHIEYIFHAAHILLINCIGFHSSNKPNMIYIHNMLSHFFLAVLILFSLLPLFFIPLSLSILSLSPFF